MLDSNVLVIIGSIAVLWAVFIFLRAPASTIFFSLLVGQLLASQLSDEALDFLSSYSAEIDVRHLSVALLALPTLITLLILRDHVSKSKRIIEAVPLLLAAASIMIFADNYLALSDSLLPEQANILRTYESLIVSAGAILSLVSSWLSYPKPGGHKKH